MEKFVSKTKAAELIKNFGVEFAVVQNPSYTHPSYELYPLAPKTLTPQKKIIASVMDMDGTTTTTEELCLHSLEFMVRKITDRISEKHWKGLDHQIDYPHIIGNSTTKHVEYLINSYKTELKLNKLKDAYIFAAVWTLVIGKDEKRKEEVKLNLNNFGCNNLLNDKFIFFAKKNIPEKLLFKEINKLIMKYSSKLKIANNTDIVKASVDIYYQRYHEILNLISNGKGKIIAENILHDENKKLIEPMPGAAIFLTLTKGLLGNEAGKLCDELLIQYKKKTGKEFKGDINSIKNKLNKLSSIFEKQPMKISIVTSSIYYEANIVMNELFRVFREEISKWNISKTRKNKILKYFSHYTKFYDAFVTASDSNEIRLKPHRDLYSIALHHLGIEKKDFNKVIGFEDSESGTIAIRAAGIGLCIAVPFAQTSGHNLSAASHILKGGLPEIILKHNIFIKY